ncbi:hypothetical protein BCR33DRAFT_719106 [Rhizoclosmatium globosum]|uniref:Uncharacterized protein n=1 Tax=Rhizoclosmatium globosum TaxID=329046 RepID=A0A1Y2C289_9FUNG|nr:hypothetical protein BCR33DRAFT_719106 [Rhizoclosmatium globosum]|eukprot:ORY41004.1 hypothetical protein BCR33DRAFT_719106 [Rhizoclosmatium globosum]
MVSTSDSIELKVSHVYLILGLFAIAMLLAFLYFVLYVETYSHKKLFSRENLMTPFNISLLVGILSLICYDFGQYALNKFSGGALSQQQQALIETVIDLCQALWGICYLSFSFVRSSTQLQFSFPRTFSSIKMAWMLSPVILLIPAFLALIKLIRFDAFAASGHSEFFWYQISQILCTILLATFDTIFLRCFILYLRQTQVDDSTPIDMRFLIISRYGVVSSGLCVVMIPLWVSNFTTYFTMSPGDENFWPNYVIITITYSCLMNFVFMILFAMKISLRILYDKTGGTDCRPSTLPRVKLPTKESTVRVSDSKDTIGNN